MSEEKVLLHHVSGHSTFDFYRDGLLWFTTDTGLGFSVPVNELGSGTVYTLNKSIVLMKWIRKQIELNEVAFRARQNERDPQDKG